MRRILPLLLAPLLLIGALFVLAPARSETSVTFSPDTTRLDDCVDRSVACYRQAFGNLAYAEGASVAFSILRERIGADRVIFDACHPLTHAIGLATLARTGDARSALSEADSLCQSGFAHAIVEREILSADDADPAAAAERLGVYCGGETLWPDPLDRAECLHGVGHGLLLAHNGDLPFVLETCDAMTSSLGYGWLRYCILGAFMELNAPIAPIDLRWLRADEPEYPCNVLEERYAITCYGQYAARLTRAGVDQAQIAGRCRSVALEPGRIECLTSLLLVIEPTDENASGIGRICGSAVPYENACLIGYVRGRADRAPTKTQITTSICEGLAIDPAAADRRSLARSCASVIGFTYLELDPSARCRSFSIKSLEATCLEAARNPDRLAEFAGER